MVTPAMVVVLTATASLVAGRHTNVVCTNWAPAEIRAVTNWAGWAYVGLPRVFLRPRWCELAYRGNRLALEVLGHEIGHSFGIANERAADRYATNRMPKIKAALRLSR